MVISATPSLPSLMIPFLRLMIHPLYFCLFVMLGTAVVLADDKELAAATAMRLVPQQEQDGFEFRSEAWVKNLEAKTGRAVRIQLFKGNEYRFCIAVAPESGVQVTAAVLDAQGSPGGEILPVKAGWGLILSYKPKKTGMHVIAIRQTDAGKAKEVPCAMMTGWK
jgi:hypothetical protein